MDIIRTDEKNILLWEHDLKVATIQLNKDIFSIRHAIAVVTDIGKMCRDVGQKEIPIVIDMGETLFVHNDARDYLLRPESMELISCLAIYGHSAVAKGIAEMVIQKSAKPSAYFTDLLQAKLWLISKD